MQAMNYLDRAGKSACDVLSDVEKNYNRDLQGRLSRMAFSEIAQSWYKDGDKVTNNWAGGTREYVKRLKKIDMDSYAVR